MSASPHFDAAIPVDSQHRRRLGSAPTDRRDAAQQGELILRALAHNLKLVAAVR